MLTIVLALTLFDAVYTGLPPRPRPGSRLTITPGYIGVPRPVPTKLLPPGPAPPPKRRKKEKLDLSEIRSLEYQLANLRAGAVSVTHQSWNHCLKLAKRYKKCVTELSYMSERCHTLITFPKKFIEEPTGEEMACSLIDLEIQGVCPLLKIPPCKHVEYAVQLINNYILSNCANNDMVCQTTDEETTCMTGNGENYVGELDITRSGKKCQAWPVHDAKVTDKYPAVLDYVDADDYYTFNENFDKIVGGGSSAPHYSYGLPHSYCRNPNGREWAPWCFISFTHTDFCAVPKCNGGDIDKLTPSSLYTSGTMAPPTIYSTWVWQKKEKTFDEMTIDDFSRCPESRPYAFVRGRWCCSSKMEDDWTDKYGESIDCAGGALHYDSICCLDLDQEICPSQAIQSPCLSSTTVSSIGMAEYVPLEDAQMPPTMGQIVYNRGVNQPREPLIYY